MLGGQPARFQRGWIEWEMGNTLGSGSAGTRGAMPSRLRWRFNREIARPTGVAITTLDLAALRLAQNETQRVIDLVRGALCPLCPDKRASAAGRRTGW